MNRLDGAIGRLLHRLNMARNLFGRLGGLHGEQLHLRGDDREPPARFAGPRGLDVALRASRFVVGNTPGLTTSPIFSRQCEFGALLFVVSALITALPAISLVWASC